MWVAETSSTSYEGRASLARRATELARAAMPGVDVEILWDGMWVRRVGPDYFPDPDMFRLPGSNAGPNAAPNWERWAGHLRSRLEVVRACGPWCRRHQLPRGARGNGSVRSSCGRHGRRPHHRDDAGGPVL